MKKIILFPIVVIGLILLQSLVVRDDVPDAKFIELAKQYPQIAHFAMGEGTVIDSSWILTVGHIGRDLKRDITNGRNTAVTCNGKKYDLEKVIVHPDFDDTPRGVVNDIALVKIKGSIKDIVPGNIYRDKKETGMDITIVGMGDIGTGLKGPKVWDKITRAATNKIDGADSLWIHFTFDAPGSANVTKLEGVSGPGDSGGPAFFEVNSKRYIVGISSHQRSTNGKGRYGAVEYYTRVSTFYNWILQSMKEKS